MSLFRKEIFKFFWNAFLSDNTKEELGEGRAGGQDAWPDQVFKDQLLEMD